MYIINGEHNFAKIMLAEGQYLDEATTSQIYAFLGNPAMKGKPIVIMPDAHKGNGSCIGFTMPLNEHVIPNVVGVDIGCGIDGYNLGKIDLSEKDLEDFYVFIKTRIPSGFSIRENMVDIPKGLQNNLLNLSVKMELDANRVFNSIGTLGGGNHFIELNKDPDENIWLTIHSGSRNFGLQVCNYHQRKAKALMNEVFIGDAYRGAEFLPLDKGGKEYLADMKVAQDYAQENRNVMAEEMIDGFFALASTGEEIKTVHNYINFADKIVRKGAISAHLKEKVLIPLNMRDGVIVGSGKGNKDWNFSAPHGAGRVLSRSAAKKTIKLEDVKEQMKGIFTKSLSKNTIDEAPDTYKKADSIINAIGDSVHIDFVMKPIFNFKAE